MAGVRTMEDFIRQRLGVDGGKRLSIVVRADGLFEASVVKSDGKTATVEVHEVPATALWNAMVPYHKRRTLPSGRSVVVEGEVHGVYGISHGPVEDLLADDVSADIEDLLS